MSRTRIDWCDEVWNPVWGCTHGCPYCYARSMARRFGLQVCGRDDFAPTWIERNFQHRFPKEPRRIFVNSMSDVADWEPEWTHRVFERIHEMPQHLFLFLSKRPWDWSPGVPINSMLGYSVTRDADMKLIGWRTSAVEFLSIEPLLGPVTLPVGTNRLPRWIIVGAETGNRKDRVVPEREWLAMLWAYARRHGIPLFFKDSLRYLWGEDFPAFPREFPA